MKRIIIITIITCLLIPFFSINTFAISYNLGDPVLWSAYSNSSTMYPSVLPINRTVEWFLLQYDSYSSKTGWHDDFNWAVSFPRGLNIRSTYDKISYRNRSNQLIATDPAIAFGIVPSSSQYLHDTLVIPALEYRDMLYPSASDIIKVEFSVDTLNFAASSGIPQNYQEYLTPDLLCFFSISGQSSLSVPVVHFENVVITPSLSSRQITFTYYFSSSGSAFANLKRYSEEYCNNAPMSLVVRFPYYCGTSSLIEDGYYIVTNADLPVSYELISPGDYSEELSNIKNAITESNENLLNYYNTLSGEDQAVIVHAKQQNDKLDSTIKDYDNAQSGIDNIIEHVTLPPVNIDDANSSFEDLGLGNLSTNKNIWQGPVIAMAVISFSFAILSLILYGKKE